MPLIGILRPLPETALAALSSLGEVIEVEPDGHRTHLDALLVTPFDRVPAGLIARHPTLRFIVNIGAGTNHIDLRACAARGIVVTNTPAAGGQATADFAFGLLIGAARRLCEADAFVRQGGWADGGAALQGLDVHGKTLGIVGFGRIGQAIAQRARGFEMPVRYHTRTPRDGALARDWRPLPALLAESDFIVLQVPLSVETAGMIGRDALALMKPTAVLVNTARGGVLDEDALVDALTERRLAYAALDVCADEPDINPRLLSCPRLLLAPHIATATGATRAAMVEEALANLRALLSGVVPAATVSA